MTALVLKWNFLFWTPSKKAEIGANAMTAVNTRSCCDRSTENASPICDASPRNSTAPRTATAITSTNAKDRPDRSRVASWTMALVVASARMQASAASRVRMLNNPYSAGPSRRARIAIEPTLSMTPVMRSVRLKVAAEATTADSLRPFDLVHERYSGRTRNSRAGTPT